jgi:hypothetical protein
VPLDRSNPLSNVSTMDNFNDELTTAISKGGTSMQLCSSILRFNYLCNGSGQCYFSMTLVLKTLFWNENSIYNNTPIIINQQNIVLRV